MGLTHREPSKHLCSQRCFLPPRHSHQHLCPCCRDGRSTSWAQPSGLSLSADGAELWVADSESSAIRSCSLATGAGRVGCLLPPSLSSSA